MCRALRRSRFLSGSLLVSQASSESPEEVSRESIELRLKLMGVGEIGHHVYRELRTRVAAKTVIQIAASLLSAIRTSDGSSSESRVDDRPRRQARPDVMIGIWCVLARSSFSQVTTGALIRGPRAGYNRKPAGQCK
jgi:hypothetical protein